MSHIEIGKLKNGSLFTMEDDGTVGTVYRVTRSGFGAGTNVPVYFEIQGDKHSPTFCAPKKRVVIKHTK